MSLDNQYQLDFYNNNIIALSNESNVSDISENPNDPDIESNSSSSEQSTSQNNGITVITNSLGKRIKKKKAFTHNKKLRPSKSWVWHYFRRNKVEKKIYCKVKTTNEDGNEDTCNQEYALLTGTGNLKSHLRQILRILPLKQIITITN
ncbi:7848_t:CDS:1 [Gigaspora rosea]|nr:7848_t:CDS:1 [Gigaspora rosea]